MAPLSDEWKKMLKVVETFYARADAEPFREPVPWKVMGLTDYPQLVKHPMDLGTVKTNIQKQKYHSIADAHQDVTRVWTNCMTYNADGSDFYQLADSLNKKYQDKYRKTMQVSTNTTTPDTSASDKRSFAKSLFTIEKEDLGRVLVQAEAKCPQAILRNATEDEVELNVDLLTPEVLTELTEFVNQVKGKKKKRKAK